jgi:hypothetical protein
MFDDPAQSRSFRLFLRYLTNAQNAYRQAKAELESTQADRLDREQQQQEDATASAAFEERLALYKACKAAGLPGIPSALPSLSGEFVSYPPDLRTPPAVAA